MLSACVGWFSFIKSKISTGRVLNSMSSKFSSLYSFAPTSASVKAFGKAMSKVEKSFETSAVENAVWEVFALLSTTETETGSTTILNVLFSFIGMFSVRLPLASIVSDSIAMREERLFWPGR